MRVLFIVLVLASLVTTTSAQAGVLTRGNVFAEGLAGCSLGIAIGAIGSILVATQVPVVTTATVNHIGLLGYCLIGTAVAATFHTVLEFSSMEQEFFHTGPKEKRVPMIYPETPGREY